MAINETEAARRAVLNQWTAAELRAFAELQGLDVVVSLALAVDLLRVTKARKMPVLADDLDIHVVINYRDSSGLSERELTVHRLNGTRGPDWTPRLESVDAICHLRGGDRNFLAHGILTLFDPERGEVPTDIDVWLMRRARVAFPGDLPPDRFQATI
jgi:hypothetical protein